MADPYCTISELPSNLNNGRPFDENKPPTIDDVNWILAQGARRIDGKLAAAGITAPVVLADSPKAYAILKDLNRMYAIAMVQRAAFRFSSQKKPASLDEDLAEFNAELNNILADPRQLQDASGIKNPHTCKSRTDELYDIDQDSIADITEHKFFKGQEW